MLEPIRLFQGAGGPMRYEFAQLAQGAEDINTAMTTMKTKLSDLDANIRPKLANWDGSAMGTYEQLKAQWDGAARNIEELLGSISRAVAQSNERMAMQEIANAMRFER